MEKIDLPKVLRSKNPKLARFVPKFVLRWVERVLRVQHHNKILELYGDRDAIGFIDGALEYIGVTYELHGVENIPQGSKLLFAANHPLGGVDGMILATAINSIRPDVRLIVNDILLNIKPLRTIFIGINKHGAQRGGLSEQFEELYSSQSPIINFAAGLCSRKVKGGAIEDLPWKNNFVVRSIASDRIVVPTYVEARNSSFFYWLGNFRKAIGIKANIEMPLLSREVFNQKGKVVKIYFGEAVTPDKSKSAKAWCDDIRQRVYRLRK